MVQLDVQKIVVIELKIAHTRRQHVEEKDYYTTNHVLQDIYTEFTDVRRFKYVDYALYLFPLLLAYVSVC